jgi:sugar/nucleoside kinase (ribokinase family)
MRERSNKSGAGPARDVLSSSPQADVVSFGMLVPATLLIVDEFPQVNTGAIPSRVTEFTSDDAAIIATTLRGWGVRSGLIGTKLGNDAAGRRTAKELKRLGVAGHHRISSKLRSPYEVSISDQDGNRTFFWQRTPEVLATLETADLSLIEGAKLLYVDWYDEDYIIRPMEKAGCMGVPVFLNFEHGHADPELLSRYARHATICQAVTDNAQLGDNAVEVAGHLLDIGVSLALVTMAKNGCLAVSREESIRTYAPKVDVVDATGAGATFSAGFIYGQMQGWGLKDKVEFAVAAASLKCTVVGPCAFPVDQILGLTAGLKTHCGVV